MLQQSAVADYHQGQARFLRRHLQLLGGGGLLVGIGQDGQLSIGFQDCVFHCGRIGVTLGPQLFQKLIYGQPVSGHLTLVYQPIPDDDAGSAAHEGPEPDAFHSEDGQDHGHGQ